MQVRFSPMVIRFAFRRHFGNSAARKQSKEICISKNTYCTLLVSADSLGIHILAKIISNIYSLFFLQFCFCLTKAAALTNTFQRCLQIIIMSGMKAGSKAKKCLMSNGPINISVIWRIQFCRILFVCGLISPFVL